MLKRPSRVWYIVAGALVVGAVLFRVFGGGAEEKIEFESATVTRGTVERIVSVTGHVEPLERVTLSFPVGGRVASVHVAEGERVARGDRLATLDAGDTVASIAEAEARVLRERALLNELRAPLRSESQALEQATVVQAETTLGNAEHSAYITLAHAYTLAHDAILEEVDELFAGGPGSPRFGLRFTSGSTDYLLQADSQTSANINAERARVTDLLAQLSLRGRGSNPILEELEATTADLEKIDMFLTHVASAINRYTPDDTEAQTVYDSFQTSVASARTSLATARSEVASAKATYEVAHIALERARRALNLALAGATTESLSTQEAAVDVALRAVDTARTTLADSLLVSPINGTVALVTPSVGEAVGPLEPVVEVLGDGRYEVEAYIPEADIADVSLGDSAWVSFDAYGDAEPRAGEVVRIALTETMREGVPTYKTTIVFTGAEPPHMQLRPGMTADVDITTNVRKDVLFLPTRSVQNKEGRTYVRVPWNGTFVERDIVTGVRGSEGTIEIVGGLAEGEEVILYLEDVP